MVTFTLKNIPDQLHRKLKKQAQRHNRSLNSEMMACLQRSTGEAIVKVEPFLKKVRQFRKTVAGHLTEKQLKKFKNKGRV